MWLYLAPDMLFQLWNLTSTFGNADINPDTCADMLVCSHWYVDAEKVLFPVKCFIITIALLHTFHLCSFVLHNFLLVINFFCQRIFHSFTCVPCEK